MAIIRTLSVLGKILAISETPAVGEFLIDGAGEFDIEVARRTVEELRAVTGKR